MTESTGSFARHHAGLPHFARVSVRVEDGVGTVSVLCSGRGFTSQGSLEGVPAIGYDAWKAGAVEGVRFALAHVGRSDVNVTLTRITGLSTDTNATIVGAAAARATWTALAVEPEPAEWARLQEIVFGSWKRPFDAVPDFG